MTLNYIRNGKAFCWSLCVAAGCVASAHAADPQLPTAQPSIPHGVVISDRNIETFRELLPPFLVAKVRGGLELDAVADIGYSWRRDDEFEQLTAKPLALDSLKGTTLAQAPRRQRGFPFGRALAATAKDQGALAAALVWNSVAGWWGEPLWRFKATLSQFSTLKLERSFELEHRRLYPISLPGDSNRVVLFKELIRFTKPSVLGSLSWLTIRQFGNEEDLLWSASPATHRSRQLTGSNRADPFVRSLFSADDMLFWSSKIESTEARILGRSVLLAPFPALEFAQAAATNEWCQTVRPFADADILNSESMRFRDAPAWVPTSLVFAPRELVQVETSSTDPYALVGRQVLYIDLESMLPVYKVAFDRSGAIMKSGLAAFGLALRSDRARKYPYPALSVMFDERSAAVEVLEYSETEICSDFGGENRPEQFDPAYLNAELATPTPSETPSATPDVTATPSEAVEVVDD